MFNKVPVVQSTLTNVCLESLKNTKRLLCVRIHVKNRAYFSPDATTVLAHKVFSMLRLS